MTDEVSIEIKGLDKTFHFFETPFQRLLMFFPFFKPKVQGIDALQKLDLKIYKGETIGVVGENGSGKTTLLQLITGTLSPSNGSVECHGKIGAILELGTGFNPDFTGLENLELAARVLGAPASELQQIISRAVEFADIGSFINRPVKTYSSGMFVRLAFALQISANPDILIIDEALAVGDTYFVHKCMDKIREFQRREKTILIVSHDANAIRTLCTRVIWLKNGNLEAAGDSSEVVDKYLRDLFKIKEVVSAENIEDGEGQGTLVDGKILETSFPNKGERSGDQKCSLIGANIYNEDMSPIDAIVHGEELLLRLSIQNNSLALNCPVVPGYVIRAPKGQELASTNSFWEDFAFDDWNASGLLNCLIKIKLPFFHPGSYSISPTLAYEETDGTLVLADRIDHAIIFNILEHKKVHVLMNLPTKFEVL